MPQPLTLVPTHHDGLTGDLQDEGCSLVPAEQNALRMTMAMRVIRSLAADRAHCEADLLIVECLLSSWWCAWADKEGWAPHPFAVEMPAGTIVEVTGLDEAEVGAGLARLRERGLVQAAAAPDRSGPRRGPLYNLAGAFRPVLPALEGVLLRGHLHQHKSDLRWAAEATIDAMNDVLGGLAHWCSPAEKASLQEGWAAFLEDHAQRGVDVLWNEDPALVYGWMSKLADFQDELSVLQAYPCDGGSIREDLARWTSTKVAVRSVGSVLPGVKGQGVVVVATGRHNATALSGAPGSPRLRITFRSWTMPKIITPSLPIPANQNQPVDRAEKLAYTVVEAARALGVGRSTLFDMIRTGELQARKLRGRTIITRAEFVRVLSDAPIRSAQAA